jgi:16S rRNA (cytosine967-C5)-methyltransferase
MGKDANPRQLAFLALRSVQRGAYADVALDRVLQTKVAEVDRRLVTELVYGCLRRQRTLDVLIDQLATKKSQPPDLRLILQLGLYQLRYLHQIPTSAAVDTTVELAKQNGFKGLAGFVNGLLRQYIRLTWTKEEETLQANDRQLAPENIHPSSLIPHPSSFIPHPSAPLQLPDDPIARLGIQHSYPDWIVAVWLQQFGEAETKQLCEWLNQPARIHLRINPLQTTIDQVEAAMQQQGIQVQRVPGLPQALCLPPSVGSVRSLPGFAAGWWAVQDCSAQLVSHLLDPQPGEVVIDACAAPGGKTTHLVELMHDRGTVWAIDRHASRLKKVQENADRLQLTSIRTLVGDSRSQPQLRQQADRVLLDAPCSGLGTLHRHADARWRQTPETVAELAQLQTELLTEAATWVKPGGTLVYATCTLHPAENEAIVEHFLAQHPKWTIASPPPSSLAADLVTDRGWIKVLPHQQQMDGFFMIKLENEGLSAVA